MKKIIFSLFAVLALGFSAMADNGDAYTIDDNAIDQVFAEAAEMPISDMTLFSTDGITMPSTANLTSASVNPWAAFIICWFLGPFGIHRHYMGTSQPMWLYYTLTSCLGVGFIVVTVDWIVLLIGAVQGDISEYCNNDQFLMWL